MTLLLLASLLAAAPAPAVPRRPVATFSIVARDPATGELGVAVQSHWFSVGAVVPWAEAGVGAVATQSFAEPSYGQLGLDLMRAGKSASDALKGLLAADDARDVRQVAMIDAHGRVAAHTGSKNIPQAGHATGQQFSAQANLMASGRVWPAMAKAYEASKGDLAERLLAALEAAQAQGGDIRGKQSAAIVVVSGTPTGRPWADREFDLRVEDSPDPLGELRRLVTLQRAYQHMNAGDAAVEKHDAPGAVREYAAAEALAPGSDEMLFWHAISMAGLGKVDDALPLLARAYAKNAGWRTLVARLPAAGLLPSDPKLVERLQAAH